MFNKISRYKRYLITHMKGRIDELIKHTSQEFYEWLKIRGVIWTDLDEKEYVVIPNKLHYIH